MYKKSTFPLLTASDWTVIASRFYAENGQNMTIECEVHFDTGSNIVILPKEIYEAVATVIRKVMKDNSCCETAE